MSGILPTEVYVGRTREGGGVAHQGRLDLTGYRYRTRQRSY